MISTKKKKRKKIVAHGFFCRFSTKFRKFGRLAIKFLINALAGPAPQPQNPTPNHRLCPPPNEKCAFLSVDCTPKKVTGSVPLECSSGPETPKILVINPVFVGKSRFFADFTIKTFFFVLIPEVVKFTRLFFLVFTQEFVEFCEYFVMKTFFLWSSLSNSREKSFCAPQKFVFAPPSHVTLTPGLCSAHKNKSTFFFCDFTNIVRSGVSPNLTSLISVPQARSTALRHTILKIAYACCHVFNVIAIC